MTAESKFEVGGMAGQVWGEQGSDERARSRVDLGGTGGLNLPRGELKENAGRINTVVSIGMGLQGDERRPTHVQRCSMEGGAPAYIR